MPDPTVTASTIDQAMTFIAARRFGTLVTSNAAGRPSAVPCVYAVVDAGDGPAVVIALDDKPKGVPVPELARVRNVQTNPTATVLVRDDTEDWDRLAWATIRGTATLVEAGKAGHGDAVAALRARYPQYATHGLERASQIWLHPTGASVWSAGGDIAAARPTDLTGITRGRRSVRSFRPGPVPREAVVRAVAAAGWAPSPHGTQPWRFVVLESRERRAELADALSATWRSQLSLDSQDPAEIERRVRNSRDRLVTPPLLVLLCRYLPDTHVYPDPERRAAEQTMATQSLGAAAQNFLLSLYADGLDAGWMCAPLFAPDVIVATLGLDPALEPHAFFPVGYAARDPSRRPRRPTEDLIARWE
jgi:coenzyme F420-0:L-glutamate ligase/coenzyme F420-1:gamma-L-glutamate ligase